MIPIVGTQTLRIKDLLTTGIRYLDLRAGYRWWGTQTVLVAYHGIAPLFNDDATFTFLKIEDIFNDIVAFLKANPTECVIVQIKQDRGAETQFARDVKTLIDNIGKAWRIDTPVWRTDNTIPMMGQVRGRIQLVRRYALPNGGDYGIDLSGPLWRDNATSDIQLSTVGQEVKIQDRYDLNNTRDNTHQAIVETLLSEAVNNPSKSVWYLNFVSAHANNRLLTPKSIALGWTAIPRSAASPGTNKMLDSYFNDFVQKPGRFGTILLDCPQEPRELLAALIKSNAGKFNKVTTT